LCPQNFAVLELRAEMGYLAQPLPPMEKYVDFTYYDEAIKAC
jgi:hypothetical protein